MKEMFKVMCPVEKKNGGGTYWVRLGTGFKNKDNKSINVYLDATPTNTNQITLFEFDEEDLRRREHRGDGLHPAPQSNQADALPF
jgi:hypothetical protein